MSRGGDHGDTGASLLQRLSTAGAGQLGKRAGRWADPLPGVRAYLALSYRSTSTVIWPGCMRITTAASCAAVMLLAKVAFCAVDCAAGTDGHRVG